LKREAYLKDNLGENPEEGQVVDPAEVSSDSDIKQHILAQINQFSERPDLFLETIEKHSPGFIKALVEDFKTVEKRDNDARYKFGKFQAYIGLIIQGLSGLVGLFGFIALIFTNQFGFGSAVGVTLFFAVSQGGVSGFQRIAEAFANILNKQKKED